MTVAKMRQSCQMRPNYSIEIIKGTIAKALRLVAENDIQKGFYRRYIVTLIPTLNKVYKQTQN